MTYHKQRYMAQVMHGTLDHTPGGLTKKDIKIIKRDGKNHYVSKKRSSVAKKNLGGWNKAVSKAKKNLGIPKNTFVLLNKNGDLYKEAARLYYN